METDFVFVLAVRYVLNPNQIASNVDGFGAIKKYTMKKNNKAYFLIGEANDQNDARCQFGFEIWRAV